jgi:hypothetical protein
MGTITGKYGSNSLGRDATGPLKPIEMDRERTRPKTVADGESFADLIDRNSREDSNYGHTSRIITKKRQ